MLIRTNYYRQFSADYSRDVPAEGYGGWNSAYLEISRENTAVVIMHAWDTGSYSDFPGWWRAVEYIPRARTICRDVFPRLTRAVRGNGMKLFHVVGGGDYYRTCPGYRKAVELAGPSPPALRQVEGDSVTAALREFKSRNVFVGQENIADVRRGFRDMGFAENARPRDDEYVAENGHQLAAVCRHTKVNHLIYAGFAVNWCLLMSPGGMIEMQKYGLMCSVVREATTAVENKESAARELCKELALWRVALAFGFVYDLDDLCAALATGD